MAFTWGPDDRLTLVHVLRPSRLSGRGAFPSLLWWRLWAELEWRAYGVRREALAAVADEGSDSAPAGWAARARARSPR